MGTIFFDTGGSASNSGTTDTNSATISGTAATAVTTTITLDAGTDLSAVVTTAGATQSAIFLSQATNSNQKIFWITGTAGSGGATPTVTVSVAPTGITTSSWAIGGRMIYTSANFEAAVRAGEVLQFNNTPATKSATFLTCRVSGDTTTGYITVQGKSGVRPVLEITNTSNVIAMSSISNWFFNNLEFKQDGASGNVVSVTGNCLPVFNNIKISAGGGDGFNSNNGFTVLNSEITGCGGWGLNNSGGNSIYSIGNYIHGNTSGGIKLTNANASCFILDNVISSNSGRGIYLNATFTGGGGIIEKCTLYNNTTSNLTVDNAVPRLFIRNNIFQSDGTNFNVVWTAGTAEINSVHNNNVFYISAGSNNLSGVTANSTESTLNPNMANPGSGDFSINNSSSAAATGFPGQLLGVANLGYLDIGAIQRLVSGGGGVFGS